MPLNPRRIPLALAAACALALLPRGASAVDGVIEINQARALAGKVTPTDDPGFPVTLDRSGSYRLTGELTVDASVNAIEVTATDGVVAIDLNGFSLTDAGTKCCAGVYVPPLPPLPPTPPHLERLRVRNGAIRHFDWGIEADGTPCTIDSVEAVGAASAHYGMMLGRDSMVTAAVVTGFASGIFLNDNSILSGSIIESNPGNGVVTWNGVLVLNNTIRNNADAGILFFNYFNGYGGNIVTGNGNGDVVPFGDAKELGTNICGNDTICP